MEARIDRGEMAALPFVLLPLTGSPALQRKAAEIYTHDKCPPRTGPAPSSRTPGTTASASATSPRIFKAGNAITHLIAELLERHDRSQFGNLRDSTFGPDVKDEMQGPVSPAAMDHFIDVRALPDHAVAQRSQKHEIDIAVDLMGFTRGSRPGIFAERAAPIQVNYLGYPRHHGRPRSIDYLIADSTLIPQASRRHYSEKIVYLPDSFQVNASDQPVSSAPSTRAHHGLPEHGFVYCCFNNNYKITPRNLRPLDAHSRPVIEGSVHWLLEDNPAAAAQPAQRSRPARHRSPAPHLCRPSALPDHLARQRLADLFLDALPFNAGATASPALWVGLPVLTRVGESFAGRMAASLLRAIDLPELITTTDAAYEALAVDLATHPQRLHAIRENLQRNRLTTPLFSTAVFTRNLEAAYTAMHARHLAHLPPTTSTSHATLNNKSCTRHCHQGSFGDNRRGKTSSCHSSSRR